MNPYVPILVTILVAVVGAMIGNWVLVVGSWILYLILSQFVGESK